MTTTTGKAMAKTATAAVAAQEHAVEFVPFGGSDKLRLTAAMVRQFIAVPTKSGALPTERDCVKFVMLCLGKRANPFEGDCFMIGYDTQAGPAFSMVCGIELFLKRAEQCEQYDGYLSGVIVMDSQGAVVERAGIFLWPGDKLVGGWARVYRKDRTHPTYKTAKLEVYDTGRSRWLKDPAGMIEKVPLSQALRAAFPTALGGLYTQEEMQRITETGEGLLGAGREPVAMPKALAEAKEPPAAEDHGPGVDRDVQPPESAFSVEPEVLDDEPPPQAEPAKLTAKQPTPNHTADTLLFGDAPNRSRQARGR